MILNMTICIYLQHNATMVMTRVKKSRRSLCLGLVAVIDVFGLLKGVLISVVAILVRLHWMIVWSQSGKHNCKCDKQSTALNASVLKDYSVLCTVMWDISLMFLIWKSLWIDIKYSIFIQYFLLQGKFLQAIYWLICVFSKKNFYGIVYKMIYALMCRIFIICR